MAPRKGRGSPLAAVARCRVLPFFFGPVLVQVCAAGNESRNEKLTTMSELAFLSATQIAAKIRGGEISAEEALRHYFDRIDRYDGALNAVILQWRDQALDAARAADAQLAAGQEVGPLHGVPMTIKESYHVAGTPATRGYPEYLANIAVGDAVAVQRSLRSRSVHRARRAPRR